MSHNSESVRIANSQDGSNYSLQLLRWFLKSVGAWPSSATTTYKEKIVSVILILICCSLIAYTIVPGILNLLFEETELSKRLKSIGPLSHWSLSAIAYFFLLFYYDNIRCCVEHMKIDWQIVTKHEDRQVMLKYAKFGRFMSVVCAIFMHIGVFSHSFLQALESTIIYVGNESLTVYVLPCPSYTKFVDNRYSPANEISLTIQLISSIIVDSIVVSACSLTATFAMHACGQLNVLMRWLKQLTDDEMQLNMVQRRLAVMVKHHLRVLSFVSCMEAFLHPICFVELLECTFNLCMLGYYTLTGWNVIDRKTSIAYMIIYLSMMFNIFMFCYIGEILTEQSKQVGETAYMTNWYNIPHKTALGLVLIISRSSKVAKLTAGKLIHLSIATFGNVMKTSLVYLNMLRTMTM